MSIKKTSVYLAVLMICGVLLTYFMQPKISFMNTDSTNSLASLPVKESSSLDTWLGEYSFSEYAPPNQNMFYSITIYCDDNSFFAKLSNDGFQKSERLLARVSGDPDFIKLEFLGYLPDNVLESYKEGDVLLSFKKIDSKIITHWGEIQPLLLKNEKAGEYFQLISSSKCFLKYKMMTRLP